MYISHELGKIGEDIVADYITKLGYKVLERNFECKQGEIDIVALDKDYIVFVEIKSRTNIEFGLPSESVTKKKLKHILKTASYYLYIKKLENSNVRIDVIEIYMGGSKHYINHIKQIV